MLFSIIIPFFNASERHIRRALDSVYSQDFPADRFEVIVVDDCSSRPETVDVVREYAFAGVHPDNLRVIRTERNCRQGGARNAAIRIARGDWAVYIDQDDFLCAGALQRMADAIAAHPGMDVIMCDYELSDDATGAIKETGHYAKVNSTEEMDGRRYVRTQEVPWTPWCTVYRIEYLREKGIEFEENVRFEDSDYVMKSLINAASVVFVPFAMNNHTESDTQQSSVGDNPDAIEDLFKISERVRVVGASLLDTDSATAAAVLYHHWFKHKSDIVRYLWRLPAGRMRRVLHTYPAATPSPHKWLDFTAKHPDITFALLMAAKPVLPLARKIFMMIR